MLSLKRSEFELAISTHFNHITMLNNEVPICRYKFMHIIRTVMIKCTLNINNTSNRLSVKFTDIALSAFTSINYNKVRLVYL